MGDPSRDLGAGVIQIEEQGLVEQLIAHRPLMGKTAPLPRRVREAILILQQEPERQQRLIELVALTHRQMKQRGWKSPSNSQIVPYIVGDNARAMRLASALQARGFDIRGIRPQLCQRARPVCESR